MGIIHARTHTTYTHTYTLGHVCVCMKNETVAFLYEKFSTIYSGFDIIIIELKFHFEYKTAFTLYLVDRHRAI